MEWGHKSDQQRQRDHRDREEDNRDAPVIGRDSHGEKYELGSYPDDNDYNTPERMREIKMCHCGQGDFDCPEHIRGIIGCIYYDPEINQPRMENEELRGEKDD